MVESIDRNGGLESSAECVRRIVRDALGSNNFRDAYMALDIKHDLVMDSALKDILADKLISSIKAAKSYAAKKQISVGISALLIAENCE